uniref:Uncharacterized protein n=1 Tax=Arundo donax TaxID=35708 RepID=A0A0A9EFM2_ARUDO
MVLWSDACLLIVYFLYYVVTHVKMKYSLDVSSSLSQRLIF